MNKWFVTGIEVRILDRKIVKEEPAILYKWHLKKGVSEVVSTVCLGQAETDVLSHFFQEENPRDILGMGFRSPESNAFSAFERLLEEVREGMAEAFISKESAPERAHRLWKS